jgi:hypothetical protein
VKFFIRRSPPNSVYDHETWEVLKKFDHHASDVHLIATYDNESLARWCLGSFHNSLEVKGGGRVEGVIE